MASKIGKRLSGATAPEVCELIYEPRLLREFGQGFRYITDVNQAHLLMLHKVGLIHTASARSIAAALIGIENDGPDTVGLDAQREDAFFNYEAHLMEKVGTDGGRLHMGRSRNDMLATQDRLRARDVSIELVDALIAVTGVALDKASKFADVVMPGYTHMRPAQPITYGFYLEGFAESLLRDIGRLVRAVDETNNCPLGAGALAGTAFEIDRNETARLLGFGGIVPNALDAVASRDFALEILAAMTLTAIGWSRIVQDLYVWSTPEFNLIDFPDSVAGTSSIMPQKKNPVVLEHLRGEAAHIIGLFTAASATIKGIPFSHTGDGNRESMRSFWEAAEQCMGDLQLLKLVLNTAEPNTAMMLRRASEDFSCVTDLADAIVRSTTLSFREAHHIVGAVVRTALDQGICADQITSAMVDAEAQAQLGRTLGLIPQLVTESLNPRIGVESRRLPGGPAMQPLREMIEAAVHRLEGLRRANDIRRAAVTAARGVLKREIRALSLS